VNKRCPTCKKGELATTTSAPMPVTAVYSCGHAFGPGTEPPPDAAAARAKAEILIAEIRDALRRGVKHYAVDGRPLTTDLEIVEALRHDGEITFEPRR